MATLQVGDTPPVSSRNLDQFRDESKRKLLLPLIVAIATYNIEYNVLSCRINIVDDRH